MDRWSNDFEDVTTDGTVAESPLAYFYSRRLLTLYCNLTSSLHSTAHLLSREDRDEMVCSKGFESALCWLCKCMCLSPQIQMYIYPISNWWHQFSKGCFSFFLPIIYFTSMHRSFCTGRKSCVHRQKMLHSFYLVQWKQEHIDTHAQSPAQCEHTTLQPREQLGENSFLSLDNIKHTRCLKDQDKKSNAGIANNMMEAFQQSGFCTAY